MLTYKYNPQNASFEELRATFTARDSLLSKTLKEIKEHSASKSNQHYLVIGQRGIGKTNFLRMIYLSIKEDSALSNNWIPLQFAEEEYSIGSLRDLFEKTLEVLRMELAEEEAGAIENFLEQLHAEERDAAATE